MKGGTQTTQPQTKTHTDTPNIKKPTAEQIQYAKLLNNEDQKHVQEQIRQVSDVTGRSVDEASVALHDCNYDTEQAINTLLEGRLDQSEWIMPSNRKKKHQSGGTTQGIDAIISTSQTGPSSRNGSRPSRGGRGGRNRSSDKGGFDSDNRDGDENSRSIESGRGRGSRDDRSSDRRGPGGRGGPPRRGRGGGRGRPFSSRGRAGRMGGGFGSRSGPPPGPMTNGPTENGTELWNSKNGDTEKEKAETWDDAIQTTEDWSQEEWTPAPVSEPLAADSLFSGVRPSSGWPDSSKEVATAWGDSEPSPTSTTTNGTALLSGVLGVDSNHDNTPYAPESDDIAIIHSKLAQSQPDQVSKADHHMMRIPMPGEMNNRNNHLGPIGKLLDNSVSQAGPQQMIHQQPQAQRQPRQSRSKKSQKSQIPVQAVEMPGTMADGLDVQFGNLEFGGDSDAPPHHQTKGMDTSGHVSTEDSRDKTKSETPSVAAEQEINSLPSSLTSSLSRTAPVTIASTTSATAGLTMGEESSPRHYQHVSSLEHKVHMPEPIPLPSQRESREDVMPQQIQERPKTPPSLGSSANVGSSLGSVSRTQPSVQSTLQAQLASSLPKESPLDSRVYQHASSQPQLSAKDQLAAVGLHHTSLNSNMNAASFQRADLSTTGSLPPAPPPGVGVPHTTLHSATSMGLTTVTVSSSSRPNQHAGKPNFPPGVLPMNTLYGMQQQGLVQAYPMPYGYDELQRLQMSGYYDPFQTQGRETLQGTYQADQKFGRSDASSPVQTTMNQAATPGQHHLQQQAYINAAMPPPYGYGGLAFYPPGSGMMAGGFPAYTQPMYQQMPTKTHGTGSQYQQQAYSNQHGSHSFNTGYDDLSAGHDYSKSAYHPSVSQAQSKANSVTSSSGDLSGSSYKGQAGKFSDSKAFLGGTPPPALNLSLQGQHSHMSNYPAHTAPYMSMMPQAQQHHQASLFHQQQQQQHHLSHHHQDMGGASLSQRGGGQQSQLSKQSQSKAHQGSYPGGPFWSNANKSL